MQTFENIRTRLTLNAAARFNCGPEELDRENRLFIDWMAREMSALFRELSLSRDYIKKDISRRMAPEQHYRAQPASAVACARPRQANFTLRPDGELFTLARPAKTAPHEIFFSPLRPTRLVNAGIRFVATAAGLEEVIDTHTRLLRLKCQPGEAFHPGELWLAVEMDKEDKIDLPLSFYFDWALESREKKEDLLSRLPLVQWYSDGEKLQAQPGFGESPEEASGAKPQRLDAEFLHLHAIEQKALKQYEKQFISVSSSRNHSLSATIAPEEVLARFGREALPEFCPDKLLWFRLLFPSGFSPEDIAATRIQINCFPVINRKMDKTQNFTPSNQEYTEIRALSNGDNHRGSLAGQGEYFLGMQRVFTKQEQYHPIAFDAFNRAPAGYYALQSGRVEAEDYRDLYTRTSELLGLINANGHQLREISNYNVQQAIASIMKGSEELEKELQKAPPKDRDAGYYLHVKVLDPQDEIYVRFWTTQGEYANGAGAAGDFLDTGRGGLFAGDCARLMTEPEGGVAPGINGQVL